MLTPLGLLEPGNVLEAWIPVGAALTGLVALLGAVLTFTRFMRSQETKIDSLGRDLKEAQTAMHAALNELRVEMNHRFERLDDRDETYLKRREFYDWVERFRQGNPQQHVPSPFIPEK